MLIHFDNEFSHVDLFKNKTTMKKNEQREREKAIIK